MAVSINVLVLGFMVLACFEGKPAQVRTNAGDVSLSINIPTLQLNDLLTKSDHRTGAAEQRENIKVNNQSSIEHEESEHDKKLANEHEERLANEHEGKAASEHEGKASSEHEEKDGGTKTTSLDLAKLLASGKPVSIKSTETSTMGESGIKEKDVKEVSISTLPQGPEESSSRNHNEPLDDKGVEKLVSALKLGLFNNSTPKSEHEHEQLKSEQHEQLKSEHEHEQLKSEHEHEQLKSEHEHEQLKSEHEHEQWKSEHGHEQLKSEHEHEQLKADEKEKENPSSGLHNDLDMQKEHKALKDKGKSLAEEPTEAKPEHSEYPEHSEHPEHPEMSSAKPDHSEASSAPKENPLSGGNQIALLPVSVPASLLSQLQSAMNGSTASGNNNLSSPSLASLLSLQGLNNNANNIAQHDDASTNRKPDKNALEKQGSFNETAHTPHNSNEGAFEDEEGNIHHKKEEEKENDHYQEEHKSGPKNNSTNVKMIGGGKDGPLLVVIPQLSGSSRRDRLVRKKSSRFSTTKSTCKCKSH